MDHLSSSQINLFLLCGLKYRYQYVEKRFKPFRPSALAFGGALHSTISWIHKQEMEGKKASPDMVLRIFDADWYSQKTDMEIRYKDNERELGLIILAKQMLQLFLEEPRKKVKGTEVPFTVPLVNPRTKENLGITLEGFFDIIEADDTIVEYKTSATTISQSDVDKHLQLTAYGYAFQQLFHKPAKGFRIVNFVKNKKPKIVSTETERSSANYEAFFFLVKEVLKAIKVGTFHPRPGYWCKDCEYGDVCPLTRGTRVKAEKAKEVEAYGE
ncbi:MAG TPA: PD-(D/E)XK nuclease family protein [Candidatus Acidoferrales bacterium]|nr:PD-(D/E)XK nuclease family protein [Candidatus Acidoferrales bacterium]